MSTDPPPPRRLQAHGVHRVTTDDVGRRVSLRHHLDAGPHEPDPEPVAPRADPASRGATVTDVVGRLLGHDDGVLLVVDRHGQLHIVAEDRIVASKVVPEHPRRPAEPADLGTRARPLFRQAARALVLDGDDRLLLAAHRPARDRQVWTAPGGGLRPGEAHQDAAARELHEELGVHVDLGAWVWSRRVTFCFAGVWLDQEERWFLARTEALDPTTAPLPDTRLDQVRWWTLDELRTTSEVLAPRALPEHLAALLRDGPPQAPVDVGR